MSAIVFLMLKGRDLTAPQNASADMVFALARGELAKADLAVYIRKLAVRSES